MAKTKSTTKERSTKRESDPDKDSYAAGDGPPFTFKKKDWADPEDDDHDYRKKIKLAGADGTTNGLDHHACFHVINGTKHRELFMLWLLDLEQLVLRKSSGAVSQASWI